MSILIKEMDMPQQCFYCKFWMMMNEGGYCFLIRRKLPFPDYLEVNKDCPLIGIPTPHGRLIDADALPKDMFLDTPIVLQKDIDVAPTIIEEER